MISLLIIMKIEWFISFYIFHMGGVYTFLRPSIIDEHSCPPGKKELVSKLDMSLTNKSCVPLQNIDVLRGIHFLAQPPHLSTSAVSEKGGLFSSSVLCSKVTEVQDISVCEDNIAFDDCLIWSILTSNYCDHFGSLEFERYWASRGCRVVVYHYFTYFKGNVCNTPAGMLKGDPNIMIIRGDMWSEKCFNCVYKNLKKQISKTEKVDVLKVQRRDGVNEDFEGVQYTVLSDLFLHMRDFVHQHVHQIVFTVAFTPATLVDLLGREAEHAWNMWASQQLLQSFAVFHSQIENGPIKQQPLQYAYTLEQAQLSPSIAYYHHSFLLLQPNKKHADRALRAESDAEISNWAPDTPDKELKAVAPRYCRRPPNEKEEAAMQRWIKDEMNTRCHPTRLAVRCERTRGYDSFIPCPQELMNHLAEDYSAMKGWCDFGSKYARIDSLRGVDKEAYSAFKQPSLWDFSDPSKRPVRRKVRLAFFFTVYADAPFVRRLFTHLYSPSHYYLFHIDAAGASREFEEELRTLGRNRSNVHFAKDIKIVYGASTATILLTKAMAWFSEYASGWDYFVPLTGSDYPLIPLHRIERIFAFQFPPMPFVMGWTPGTSTHIFRLQKTHPVFETDPHLAKSITAVSDERGRVLGAVPMEFRSNNFGPPLFCRNMSSFYHLDNRQNKSARIFDTQWLFPRDVFPGRGRAYAEENRAYASPSFDGQWRVWKKSDPATTGAYDKMSVDYIVNSMEGRKYWHFFKNMLLGSEEHYYISLLYNWSRTKAFVQTLSAQVVWNTWKLGLYEQSAGFQTHTHFLSVDEWDILSGFAKRGMMFARKFSSKKTAVLLDMIDKHFLLNDSTDAGLYWPGFFPTDVTSPGPVWKASLAKKLFTGDSNGFRAVTDSNVRARSRRKKSDI